MLTFPSFHDIYNMSRIKRNPDFAYAKTKAQISCAVNDQLISAFVFATRIVQFLAYLYLKFQASSPPASMTAKADLCRTRS